MKLNFEDLKAFLDAKVIQYNQPGFITNDPVCIPHLFTNKQDIEIMGFWSAMLAWGQRVTIINKCKELIALMDGAPHDFIMNHQDTDLKKLLNFKHRTFNATDTLYFIHFFRHHYSSFDSLEDAFLPFKNDEIFRDDFKETLSNASSKKQLKSEVCFAPMFLQPTIEGNLNYFRSYFFSLPDFPHRTIKHVSSPQQKSTCKRLNMFLRWMVRNDENGVDFGIWNRISPAQLICPCDLHVDRVARKLGIISRKQTDWQTALELTENLRQFDPQDPVKYDFALFGLGIEEKFQFS
ncbi:TIGR02757 family protein [Pedobacter cryophilus]|uniref:TIGR02757 family protein n=1 Tax=Pedobacter cryophilus TaxID=2571271 RepID=A0A4U1BVD7_9SPHI|nr:TIGR02757 family protein [Pedobacter cryophilus]TKB96081.1 TIGR02757 family protein [Pedobacter cryophilus]